MFIEVARKTKKKYTLFAQNLRKASKPEAFLRHKDFNEELPLSQRLCLCQREFLTMFIIITPLPLIVFVDWPRACHMVLCILVL